MIRGVLALLVFIAACRGGRHAAEAPSSSQGDSEALPAIMVKVAQAFLTDVSVIVSGPGRTESTETHEVGAPFDGVLLNLLVSDGDRVRKGQVLGWIASSDSEAALAGARAMIRSAVTPRQHREAQRALQLAERGLVKAQLKAQEAGIVLSHGADEGARLSANQSIVTIVATDAIVFVAQIEQGSLAQVHPGQPATIELAAQHFARQGTVHAVLAGGSETDITAPVRIDFFGQLPRQINLFGVAHIRVGTHPGALVVPKAAVLRDDVTGVSRVAVVQATNRVRWLPVHVGLESGPNVELLAPPFPPGTRVVVVGQVGLPDGTLVRVVP